MLGFLSEWFWICKGVCVGAAGGRRGAESGVGMVGSKICLLRLRTNKKALAK